jgi:hypothetical protein
MNGSDCWMEEREDRPVEKMNYMVASMAGGEESR